MDIREELKDVKEIFQRLRKKDFSGNAGQAVKNSSYQISTNVVAKIGSLIFTIVLARIILPERFGLYSLAIGTIAIFTAFTAMGIGETLIRFISKSLRAGKQEKAKAYFSTLLRWRIYLILVMALFLAIASYWVANYFYQKPIFLALLAGILYLPLMSLTAFFEAFFMSLNNFRKTFFKEVIFQTVRFVFVISLVLFLIETTVSNKLFVATVILGISFCYLVTFLYYYVPSKKVPLVREELRELSSLEKENLKKFLLPLTATALSGIFFGYIDMIMLGHFVSAEFVAYYSAAFNLAASAGVILSFAAISLLPIFSRIKGKALESGLKRARRMTLLLSFLVMVFVFWLAEFIVRVTYGPDYLIAITPLRILSLLILLLPLIALYVTFFTSQEKTKIIARLLISTTILNIILNYFFITNGLQTGMIEAIKGACYATIISKVVYFSLLLVSRKTK
ncbi:MAG: hypothetical protein BV456_07965 [Thermoplasmata archaeon M8B2D]|nr:MAG: hypothetical protein BV456_07965 [Thermoplasmata archaeon M8B2D]